MCGDDESSFPTVGAVLIVLVVSITLLILVIAIVVICLVHCKKREKNCQVQLDREQHIPHILLETSNSATTSEDMKHVKLNVACGKVNILGTGSDVKYLKSNVAYAVSVH